MYSIVIAPSVIVATLHKARDWLRYNHLCKPKYCNILRNRLFVALCGMAGIIYFLLDTMGKTFIQHLFISIISISFRLLTCCMEKVRFIIWMLINYLRMQSHDVCFLGVFVKVYGCHGGSNILLIFFECNMLLLPHASTLITLANGELDTSKETWCGQI